MQIIKSLLLMTAVLAISTYGLAGPLPDTGQTKCYDDAGNEITCPQPGEDFFGQDGNYTINPPSYTKLDSNSNDLPDSATEWVMVRDNVTGLIWEVKTNDGSIHDTDNEYTWQESQDVFIAELNASRFGGYTDWRLPTIKELTSIVKEFEVAIDTDYFPYTSSFYWSSTTYAGITSYVWYIFFNPGSNGILFKSDSYYVRAVRDGQSDNSFVDNRNGTVTDTSTGLMWQKATAPGIYTWKEAFSYCEDLTLAGYTDWRLPNFKELQSIVDYKALTPAIETDYFPHTELWPGYWSSTTFDFFPICTWYINFLHGDCRYDFNKSSNYYVRAVRGGQNRLLGHLVISVPAQASNWDTGSSMPITWETQGIAGNVRISISQQGGKEGTFEGIAEDIANDGSYEWTVTGDASGNCVLKIEPLSDPPKGNMQGLFTITQMDALIPGGPYQGTVYAGWLNRYSLETEKGRSLLVEVVPQAGIASVILDGKLGAFPTYAGGGEYTTRKPTARGKYDLFISPTEAGTYYFSLFGYDVSISGGEYTITARYLDRYLSDFSPRSAGNAGNAALSLKGLGFAEGVQVKLSSAGLPELMASEVIVSSATDLVTRFNLSGATPGHYDLTVIWSGGAQNSLGGAFEITSEGIGPRLVTSLGAPEFIRPARTYTLWVEYKNTGDADMPAPLLTITGNCPVSIYREKIEGQEVQMLGIGTSALPGILGIGESRRIPLYFIAPSVGNAEFQLWATSESSQTIDWVSQKGPMKPPEITQEDWDVLFPKLIARLGDTWTDYLGVSRADALRMKRRGLDVYDIRRLIRLEARQAAGEPVAAITDILKDIDTGSPVKGAPVTFKSTDGSIFKQTTTFYSPEGRFVMEDLPDGTYDVLPEGYYLDNPVTITISNQQDANGNILSAKKIPAGEPLEKTSIPDHDPSITKDDAGRLYLVWEHGNEIWWAINEGSGWGSYGKIPNAEGTSPAIVYDPLLLDKGTSPGLFCAWEAGISPMVILYSVGRPGEDTIAWSAPQALTGDQYDDYAIALVVDNNHNPLVLWLQSNLAVEDDTDLYYGGVNIGTSYPNWREKEDESEETSPSTTAVEVCYEVGFPPEGDVGDHPKWMSKKIPKWIPIIGGEYGFRIFGKTCDPTLGCDIKLSGKVGMSCILGKDRKRTVDAEVKASWKTEKKTCSYIFDEGRLSGTVKYAIDLLSPKVPLVMFLVPIGTFRVGGRFEGNVESSLIWKSNFPAWPDQVGGKWEVGAGPKGTVTLATGLVGGEVTGIASVVLDYKNPPFLFEFGNFCLSLEGKVAIGWGMLSTSWKRKWGSCPKANTLLAPLWISTSDRFLRTDYNLIGDVPVYEELEYVKEPLQGTGSVYEGVPVLGDITQDIYNDGVAAVAKSSSGEIIVVWTKDFPPSDLGAKVYAANYDGSDWTDPVEITPEVNFNEGAAVVFDSNGNPMAVWSRASNAGLDFEQNSVEELLDAIDKADIFYSRRIGGVWTAPEPIASLAGKDSLANVSSGPNGAITATWINQSDSGSIIYAAIWDGANWSEPTAITTAALAESPVSIYSDGSPVVVWAQDGDGNTDTFDDWRLFSTTWDGSSWSTPAVFQIIEAASPNSQSLVHQGLPLSPPKECCDEEEEDPDPPDGPRPPGKKDPYSPRSPSNIKTLGPTRNATLVIPIDPNEKAATQGEGEQHYVNTGARITYTVYFENKSEATAPAQEAFITDYLDSSLDWTTLRVEEFAFGSSVLANRANTAAFSSKVTIGDYREGEEKNWWVDINTEFSATTGRLSATFRTLDPDTGDLPEDPFAGFLPPEDGTGRGQGHVTFSACTKKDLHPGATVTNRASIVFDTNAPIATNTVLNTIFEQSVLAPTAVTLSASSATTISATLNGTVNPNGGETTVVFEWSTDYGYGNTITATESPLTGTTVQSVSAGITNLTPGTPYHFRVKASNSAGTSYGNTVTLTTDATTPTVTTTTVSLITSNSASSGGAVHSDGGASVTARGVCWSVSANPTTADNHTSDGTGTGSFTSSIKGLDLETTYYVRAYATNSAGTGYGDDIVFITSASAIIYVEAEGICGGKAPCFDSITEGIASAADEASINIAEGTYDEDIILNEPKELILQGGWDAAFTSQSSYTIANSLIIRQGKIITYNLVLKHLIEPISEGPDR